MRRFRPQLWALLLATCVASFASIEGFGEDPKPAAELAAKLADLDERMAAKPDDPLLHYQRAQLLAKLGEYDDAYAAAQTAMDKFKLAKKELAWLALDVLDVDGHKVMVLFNMGASERTPPEDGITRPLTFRIFAKDGASIVDTFDFEIGYLGGKPLTGCFGQTYPDMHANLGPVDPATPYSKIRPAAMKLIAQMVKEGSGK